ncbi:MAG: Hpt domain-containing protein [Sphingobacteriales bacterium JAD_PAG50586_3]|nr:MAG: Hpt domain-containing protein [Sphingobacteriales bacterium JAD_PAG50586_3]
MINKYVIQEQQGSLYSLATIEEISGGSREFMRDMMQLFIETMPRLADEMVEALNNQNWAGVKSVAHQVKPTMELMGVTSLKDDVVVIEKNAMQQTDLDIIPALVEKFYAIVQKIVDALRTEIKFYQ